MEEEDYYWQVNVNSADFKDINFGKCFMRKQMHSTSVSGLMHAK